MNMNQCMVDIETLDSKPEALVLSIGLVAFDPRGKVGEFADSRLLLVDYVDAERFGRTISAATVAWWSAQSPVARAEAFDTSPERKRIGFRNAMEELLNFYAKNRCHAMWANSPTFDCAILRSSCEAAKIKVPWNFREERDFRTLCRMFEPAPPQDPNFPSGTAHSTVDDAKYQAAIVQHVYGLYPQVLKG